MDIEVAKISNLGSLRANLFIMIAAMEAKGFTKCENLVRMKAELAALDFDRYKEKYPQYLFFTDEKLDEIVKRNKLVVTQVSEYTGNIPDDCWAIIQNENIDPEDLREPTYEFKIGQKYGNFVIFSGKSATIGNYEELKEKKVESIAEWLSEHQREEGTLVYKKKLLDYFYNGNYKGTLETRKIDIELIEKERHDGLYIAAPEHMTTGNTVKLLPRVLGAFQAKPLDPIVFRKVKEGVLVITFWK